MESATDYSRFMIPSLLSQRIDFVLKPIATPQIALLTLPSLIYSFLTLKLLLRIVILCYGKNIRIGTGLCGKVQETDRVRENK